MIGRKNRSIRRNSSVTISAEACVSGETGRSIP
nr:MAG TPA: hypothetical protein [Microviridae sp.]